MPELIKSITAKEMTNVVHVIYFQGSHNILMEGTS